MPIEHLEPADSKPLISLHVSKEWAQRIVQLKQERKKYNKRPNRPVHTRRYETSNTQREMLVVPFYWIESRVYHKFSNCN